MPSEFIAWRLFHACRKPNRIVTAQNPIRICRSHMKRRVSTGSKTDVATYSFRTEVYANAQWDGTLKPVRNYCEFALHGTAKTSPDSEQRGGARFPILLSHALAKTSRSICEWRSSKTAASSPKPLPSAPPAGVDGLQAHAVGQNASENNLIYPSLLRRRGLVSEGFLRLAGLGFA